MGLFVLLGAAWRCRLLSCRRLRCMPSATRSSKNSSQAAEPTSYSKQQGKLGLQPDVRGKQSWDSDVGTGELGCQMRFMPVRDDPLRQQSIICRYCASDSVETKRCCNSRLDWPGAMQAAREQLH